MKQVLRRMDRCSLRSFLVVSGLFYFLAFALVLFHLDIDNLLRDVNRDDSFYYFQIARSVANGLGSTCDGINVTNGYHPFFLALIVPVFCFFDTVGALWAIKVVEAILLFGTFAFFSMSLRNAGLSKLFAIPLLITFVTKYWSGMEIAAHMFVLSMGLWAFTQPPRSRARNTVNFCHIFLALLPWVRLESITVGYGVIALLLLSRILGQRTSYSRRELMNMTLVLTGSLLVYLTYNWIVFDTPVPISGLTKQEIFSPVTEHMENMLAALAQGRRYTAVVLAAAALWLFIILRKRSETLFQSGLFLTACALASLARLAYTGLTVGVGFGMYGWYFVPAIFSGMVCSLAALALLYASRYAGLAMALLALIIGAVVYVQVDRVRSFHLNGDPDWQILSYRGTLWMNENLPAGSIIASKDSGVVGYFSKNPVINTDGLVNSHAYFLAQKQNQRWQFLKKEHVQYYANLVRKTTGPCWTIDNASFRKIYELPAERGDHSDWAFMVFELIHEQ